MVKYEGGTGRVMEIGKYAEEVCGRCPRGFS